MQVLLHHEFVLCCIRQVRTMRLQQGPVFAQSPATSPFRWNVSIDIVVLVVHILVTTIKDCINELASPSKKSLMLFVCVIDDGIPTTSVLVGEMKPTQSFSQLTEVDDVSCVCCSICTSSTDFCRTMP